MDPRSFSLAFLLSINCPSGITLAFSTLYLWTIYQNVLYLLIKSFLLLYMYIMYIFIWSNLPLLEVTIEDSAGETLSADSDTLQYTVTPQLMDNQEVLHET